MMECPQCQARYADNFKFCGTDGTQLRAIRVTDPLLGHVIAGTYRIHSALGSGGYGVVYKASHERLPSFVAIKVLSRQRAKDDVAVARFKREVEAEAVVVHPHVVKVLDYGHDAFAGYFIVMEHLVGEDLGGHLERGKLPHILDTFAILEQAGSALAAAHRMGDRPPRYQGRQHLLGRRRERAAGILGQVARLWRRQADQAGLRRERCPCACRAAQHHGEHDAWLA